MAKSKKSGQNNPRVTRSQRVFQIIMILISAIIILSMALSLINI